MDGPVDAAPLIAANESTARDGQLLAFAVPVESEDVVEESAAAAEGEVMFVGWQLSRRTQGRLDPRWRSGMHEGTKREPRAVGVVVGPHPPLLVVQACSVRDVPLAAHLLRAQDPEDRRSQAAADAPGASPARPAEETSWSVDSSEEKGCGPKYS